MNFFIYVLAALGFAFIIFLVWIFKIYLNVKKEKKSQIQIMPFRDNEAAFEMACKYMDADIILDKPVIAISLQDMKKSSEPIIIKVAGEPPFHAHTATHYTGDHLIKKGDLLGVMPFKKTEHITSYMEGDERKQWLFLVTSELNPKYHMIKKTWSIKNNFLEKAAAREADQSHNNKIYGENKKGSTNSKILYFKDNESAFDVAATMHYPVFSEKSMCIGIVRYIDPQDGSGIIIELAGSDEPLCVMGFNDEYSNSIKHGDLVYWGFLEHSDENALNIKAIGHILAILKPEFNPNTKKWGVKQDLTQ